MTLLPIVQRELRAASRRRTTFRVRWWVALVALAISFSGMAILAFSKGARGPGNPLFVTLTGYAFLLCLLSGVLLTSDVLSQEKREGTLGLLLLTDLKGYDIVLGKLFAHSLTAAYALLAIVPATALPVLNGGVGGQEFLRTTLALCNALFVSLAAGMLVSAFSRESQNALGNGLGLVVALAVLFPVMAAGFRFVGGSSILQVLAWFSPSFCFAHAGQAAYTGHESAFWGSLGLAHGLGWGFLAIASLALPSAFRDRPVQPLARRDVRKAPLSAKYRLKGRELLTKDPVRWLLSSELGTPWAAWTIVLLWAIAAIGVWFMAGAAERSMLLVRVVVPFGFFIKLFFAGLACRFFVDARRNGTLELLLCTPLSSRDLIQGQMISLVRRFAGPFIALLVILIVPLVLDIAEGLLTAAGTALRSSLASAVFLVVFMVRLVADVFAILWLGTALALTSRRPALASAWIILLVLIIPAPLSLCWVDILLDLVFISWGINRCQLDLRRLVAEQYQVLPAASANPPGLPHT